MIKALPERDIQMLNSISNLRFMNTQQIHQLHGYAGDYGPIVTRRKLRELEREGYLKSWQPSKYEQKVFYLTQKAAEEVEHYCGYDKVSTYRKSEKTLHQVMVSEVYVQLNMIDTGKIYRFALETKIDEGVIADAFVELRFGERAKIFFLEVDRGTESISHIRGVKLQGYNRINTSGIFQRKFGIFPDVIFITESDTRKRSLLRLTEKFNFKIKVFTFDEFTSHPLIVL